MRKINKISRILSGMLINNCPPTEGNLNFKEGIHPFLIKFLTMYFISALIGTGCNPLIAQYIKTSSKTQYSYNTLSAITSTVVHHSGCDIDRTAAGGFTPVFHVTVWDSTPVYNNLIGWSYDDDNGTVTSDLWGLPDSTYDPDVAIIKQHADTFYVLVAYLNVMAGGAYAAVYRFIPSTFTWSSPTITMLATTNVRPNAINIDSDDGKSFAIVWDEYASGNIKVHIAAGNMQGSPAIPTFCTTNYTLPDFRDDAGGTVNPPYTYPDVAVFHKNSGGSGAVVSFLADTGSGGTRRGMVMVTQDLALTGATSVCNNNLTSPQNVEESQGAATSTEHYSVPRIARHKRTSSYNQLGWTVVWAIDDQNTGKTDIAGLTTFYTGGGFAKNGLRIYTDGTAPFFNTAGPTQYLPDINEEINTNPVVAYERRSGSDNRDSDQVMVIAFDHFDGSSNYPLSFYAQDGYGTPYNNTTPSQYLYYQVPTSPTGDERVVSVSGDMSAHFLYTWWDAATTLFMYFKVVNSKVNLREGLAFENNHQSTTLFITNNYSLPSNFPNEYKQFELYSISGNLVGKLNGNSSVNSLLDGIAPGLYLAKFTGNKGDLDVRKLIKQ